MDKIEEVKKIIGHFRQLEYIDHTSYQAGINADSNLTGAAKEISQLFEPKPDQSIAEQVLSELKDDLAELARQIKALPGESVLNLGDEVLHKIVAKTTEICDKRCADERAGFGLSVNEAAVALCEARLEALIEALSEFLNWYDRIELCADYETATMVGNARKVLAQYPGKEG